VAEKIKVRRRGVIEGADRIDEVDRKVAGKAADRADPGDKAGIGVSIVRHRPHCRKWR
jgi:hypothetical protein